MSGSGALGLAGSAGGAGRPRGGGEPEADPAAAPRPDTIRASSNSGSSLVAGPWWVSGSLRSLAGRTVTFGSYRSAIPSIYPRLLGPA